MCPGRCRSRCPGRWAIGSSSSPNGSNAVSSRSPSTERFFESGKEGLARQDLFNTISPIYDELNDVLSLGLHRVWKRMAVRWSRAKRGDTVLDTCCGSGDIAQIASEVVGKKGRVVGYDFSESMLDYAAKRHENAEIRNIEWVQGDAMSYPYGDSTFDAATMGYGLRNVSDRGLALRELARVVKKGAYVSILDFANTSDNALVDGVQGFLLENVVVPYAESQGAGDQYRYLRPSIEGYPRGDELERMAKGNGFREAVFYSIGFGLMGVLVCRK